MRCARGLLLLSAICIGANARAQELTISGRVVSADGAPMTMAFVYLDSLKLIARVDSSGNYVLEVPASAAQGQQEKLVAMAAVHIRSNSPVTLAGAAIWRDFVLQVDTMPEHKRLHPTLTDGRTEKSATDITISGRVTDSAGAALPTATVRVAKSGFVGMTDSVGRYTVVVPARMNGQRVELNVMMLPYAQTIDSVRLNGRVTTRDFVLSKPIFHGRAEPLDSEVARAAGLTDLRNGPHRSGEREIRIRLLEGGIAIPYELYVFTERGGKASGEYIRYYHARNPEEHITDSGEFGQYFLRNCSKVVFGELFACRVRLKRQPDWNQLWKSLDSLDIWNIADEGSLGKRRNLVFDATGISTEMWDGHAYKAWAYEPGVEDDGPGKAKVSAVSKLLENIDALIP